MAISKSKKGSKKSDSLTAIQKAFVLEYLIDLNGSAAAVRAGYSAKCSRVQASQLLADPKIKAAVQFHMDKRAKRTEIDADRVLQEVQRMAYVDIGDAFDDQGRLLHLKDMPEDVRRAIASIKTYEEYEGSGKDKFATGVIREIKFWDKPKSNEMLGRHLKMFTDKIELVGKEIEGMTDAELDAEILRLEQERKLR